MQALSSRLLAVSLGICLGIGVGCAGEGVEASYPQPEVFARPSDFSGMWMGEVGGTSGVLDIDALGSGRYRGIFRAENEATRYILALEQDTREDALANLVRMTWQDGRGGRGHGWLLINREDTAITGAYGEGDSPAGLGEWTFIRLE